MSRAISPDEAFYRFWQEVQLMQQNSERSLGATLLIFPELDLFGNYDLFESYCDWYVRDVVKSYVRHN